MFSVCLIRERHENSKYQKSIFGNSIKEAIDFFALNTSKMHLNFDMFQHTSQMKPKSNNSISFFFKSISQTSIEMVI